MTESRHNPEGNNNGIGESDPGLIGGVRIVTEDSVQEQFLWHGARNLRS
jgi:hypothetical protein